MVVIPINPRAIDADTLIDGARSALVANATIASLLNIATYPNRIAPEAIEEGVTAPYIVLALASVVYESDYNLPGVNALLDVSCYTEGFSTTTVRQLMTACLSSLLDVPWTASGMTLTAVTMEESGTGVRPVSVVTNGIMTRGRQATIRIHATKP